MTCGAGCENSTTWQPVTYKQYKEYFRQLLVGLKTNIPRLYVNVVKLMSVSTVYNVTLNSEYCRILHDTLLEWECSCAFLKNAKGEAERRRMDNLTAMYNQALAEIVTEVMEEQSNDFAAVLQPGFTKPNLDSFPVSFLSTIDCFHPSLAAHQAMAKVLWNNMLSRGAAKDHTFDYTKPYICPTEDTLLPLS